jgi:uncharacterized protein YlxW (UPF0749 family)
MNDPNANDPGMSDPGTTDSNPRSRLAIALRPRATRAQAAIGVLFALLGFGMALQVRTTASTDSLGTARESDLIRILDELTTRNQDLAVQQRDLQGTIAQLSAGSGQGDAALTQARGKAQMLGILAGTVKARGPGVVVQVPDPDGQVDAATLVDAIEELRDAGAEALQVGPVLIVASSYFLDAAPGTVVIDGTTVRAPYVITAIGDAQTLSAALKIPGGVTDTLRQLGSSVVIDQRAVVEVAALRAAVTPQYARAP